MNKYREYYQRYDILPEDTDWALRNGYRLEGGIWKKSEKGADKERRIIKTIDIVFYTLCVVAAGYNIYCFLKVLGL